MSDLTSSGAPSPGGARGIGTGPPARLVLELYAGKPRTYTAGHRSPASSAARATDGRSILGLLIVGFVTEHQGRRERGGL